MISIIISTRNRTDVLPISLPLLFQQDLPKDQFEIILMDNASSDNTYELARKMAEEAPCAMRCYRNEVGNLSRARNLGVRAARGEVVLFMNDDILAEPFLLAEHARFHSTHPEPEAAVLIRVDQVHRPGETPFESFMDPFPFHEIVEGQPVSYLYFWTNNISLKRTFMLENGLFDEEFSDAGHEDVELGYRLSQKGLRLYYIDQLSGHHYHFQTFDYACRQQYSRGLTYAIAQAKIPDREFRERLGLFSWHNRPSRIIRDLAKGTLFNSLTIGAWRALLESRKRRSWLADHLYWKVLTYYTNAGYRDALRDRTRSTPR